MAKPIEATPILNEEEWKVFINTIHNTAQKPFKKHSVNVDEIRKILRKDKNEYESHKMD